MPFVPGPSSIANSGVEGKLNKAIPASLKLPKDIGKVGPPVDTTRDHTVQPPRADDQPRDEPPTKATSPPADEAQDWVRSVHPDGWIYFFKQHDDELEGIKRHEIHVASEDEIATNAKLNTSAFTDAANHEHLSEAKESGRAVALEFRESVQMYVDDSRWYASENKELLLRQQLTDEEGNELQCNYWTFMHEYPAHHSLPRCAMTAVRQALTCYVTEGLLRRSRNWAPFTMAESRELLEHFDVIEKNDHGKEKDQPPATAQLPSLSPMKTMLVAWVLRTVATQRQINGYGRIRSKGAVNARDLEAQPGVMFMLVSFICLFSPLYHRSRIYDANESALLRGSKETWAVYVDALVGESSTFNLAATVLLSASVGFLAVPGVDAVTRIIALLSVVFTLGSIVTGVYLLWHEQSRRGRLEQFGSLLSPVLDVNLLAIILSLPFAFLAWGVATLLVAIISYSFLGFQTTIDGSNVPIRGRMFILVLVLSVVMLTAMLIIFDFFRHIGKSRRFPW